MAFWSFETLGLVAELDGAGATVAEFVRSQPVGAPEHLVRDGRAYRVLTDF